jgi:hypothetical protein
MHAIDTDYFNEDRAEKAGDPLERLLPAQVLAGLRNAVILFDTNDRHYHEPGPREGEEKAFAQPTSCDDDPCLPALVGLFQSGGCNGVAAPPFPYVRDLPMRGDQSLHSGKNNQ